MILSVYLGTRGESVVLSVLSETQKIPNFLASGAIIDAVGGYVSFRSSVQAPESLLGYV